MGLCLSCLYNKEVLLRKNLEKSDKKTDYFSFCKYECLAKVVHIYDGDTVHLVLPLPHTNRLRKVKARLYGIDTPEMRIQEQKDSAMKAKERLVELLEKTNYMVNVKCGDFDKYGRVLVTIYSPEFSKSLNDILIEEGHAYAYFGKTKKMNLK